MFPENVKWDAVFQSIVDTWLPLIGVVAAIVVIAVIVHWQDSSVGWTSSAVPFSSG